MINIYFTPVNLYVVCVEPLFNTVLRCPPIGRTGGDRLHLGCSWGCVILGCINVWLASYNCNAHPWLHEVCSFWNRIFLISWRRLLQGFVVLLWLHFHALHHMKPQRERSDGVRLGGISFSFRADGKEGLLPVSNECWMVHQYSSRMQSVWCFQRFPTTRE